MEAVAVVRPLLPEGFLVQPLMGMSPVLLGDNESGFYDDIPYFLDDLRSLGFLGRQIAEVMSFRALLREGCTLNLQQTAVIFLRM